MRTTDDQLVSIDVADLATVTGGCKKKSAPQQAAPACNCTGGEVSVEVSTGGAAGAQPGASQAPQLI